jgi:monoamine oxidase
VQPSPPPPPRTLWQAASDLKAKGYKVQVLEGRSRIGGRVHSATLTSGTSIEVGAQW